LRTHPRQLHGNCRYKLSALSNIPLSGSSLLMTKKPLSTPQWIRVPSQPGINQDTDTTPMTHTIGLILRVNLLTHSRENLPEISPGEGFPLTWCDKQVIITILSNQFTPYMINIVFETLPSPTIDYRGLNVYLTFTTTLLRFLDDNRDSKKW